MGATQFGKVVRNVRVVERIVIPEAWTRLVSPLVIPLWPQVSQAMEICIRQRNSVRASATVPAWELLRRDSYTVCGLASEAS
jgi:hypothetical protein